MQSTKSNSSLGIIVAIVGLVLIIAGGSYALYERYVVGGHRLSQLAFNPIVDALGVIGVVLLIVGVAMYYRMKAPQTTTTTQRSPSTSGQTPTKGNTNQKNTGSNDNNNNNKKNNSSKS